MYLVVQKNVSAMYMSAYSRVFIMDVGFEAYWQMNTRASASSVTAAASRAADMTTREDALRLAVRQAKPASRLEKTMHRAMRRTQDMSMSLSSWSSSTSASSSSQDAITSSVQLAELISAVKRGDETACTHWAGLAAQHDILDQRAERHRSGGAFLLSAPPLWLAVYSADVTLTLQLLDAGADPDARATACVGGSGSCDVRWPECASRRSCARRERLRAVPPVAQGCHGCTILLRRGR